MALSSSWFLPHNINYMGGTSSQNEPSTAEPQPSAPPQPTQPQQEQNTVQSPPSQEQPTQPTQPPQQEQPLVKPQQQSQPKEARPYNGGGKFSRNNHNNNNNNRNNRNNNDAPTLFQYHYPIEALLEMGDANWLLNHSTVSANTPALVDTNAKSYLQPFYSNYLNWIPSSLSQSTSNEDKNNSSSSLPPTELIPYPYLQFLPSYTKYFPSQSTESPIPTPKQPAILLNPTINAEKVDEYMKYLGFPETHDPSSTKYLGPRDDSDTKQLPPLYMPKISILFDPTLDLGSLPVTAGHLDMSYRTVTIDKSPNELLIPKLPPPPKGDVDKQVDNEEKEEKEKFSYWSVQTRKNTSKPFFDNTDSVSVLIPKVHKDNTTDITPSIETPLGLTLKHFLHFYLNHNYSLFPLPITPNDPLQPPTSINRFPFELNYTPSLISVRYPQNIPGRAPNPNQEKSNLYEAVKAGASQRILYDLHFSSSLSHGIIQAITPNLNNVLNKIQFQTNQREKDQKAALDNHAADQAKNDSTSSTATDSSDVCDKKSSKQALITVAGFNQIPMQPNFLSRCLYHPSHFDGLLFDIHSQDSQSNKSQGESDDKNTDAKFLSINSHYSSNLHLHPQHIVPLNIHDLQIPTRQLQHKTNNTNEKPSNQEEDQDSITDIDNTESEKLKEWIKISPELVIPEQFFDYKTFNTTALLVDISDNVTPLQREKISMPSLNGSNMGRLPLVHHIEATDSLNEIDHDNDLDQQTDDLSSSFSTDEPSHLRPDLTQATAIKRSKNSESDFESNQKNGEETVQLGAEEPTTTLSTAQLTLIPTELTVDNCIPGIIDDESRKLLESSNAVSSSPKPVELQMLTECFNHAFFSLDHSQSLEYSRKLPSFRREVIEMYSKALNNSGNIDGFTIEGLLNDKVQQEEGQSTLEYFQSIPFYTKDVDHSRYYQVNYKEQSETSTARHDGRTIKPCDLLAKHFPHQNHEESDDNSKTPQTPSSTDGTTHDDIKTFEPFKHTSDTSIDNVDINLNQPSDQINYTNGGVDTTINNTLFSHTITCLNHSYTPVNFNSKPIVGICVVMRGCSGSGKSTLTRNLFSRRSFDKQNVGLSYLHDNKDKYTPFEYQLLTTLDQIEKDSLSQIMSFIDQQSKTTDYTLDTHLYADTYVTGSDIYYEVPVTQAITSTHPTVSPSSTNNNIDTQHSNPSQSLKHSSLAYCWDPTVLGLTHYICQAKALNAMSFHWSRFLFRLAYLSSSFSSQKLNDPTFEFPSLNRLINLAQSQDVKELPILLIDNTSLNARSIQNYFTSCVANGFILINLEPTTPWGATNFLLIKRQLLDYTNKKSMEKEIVVKEEEEEEEEVSEEQQSLISNPSPSSTIPSQKQFLSQFNLDTSIISRRGHGDDPIDFAQLQLGAKLEAITNELFQRNTHDVPFAGIKGMLSSFNDIDDVYDLILP